MEQVKVYEQDGVQRIAVSGRLDSSNAKEIEEAIFEQVTSDPKVIVDFAELVYISSAGLRVMLRLKKKHSKMKIINASSEIYEIFEMTGFSEMIEVERAFRVVDVEGCQIIGEGANAVVYKIDGDTIVKAYRDADALDEIRHERELARTAFVLGVPTAISYDVVKLRDGRFGAIYELLDCKTFQNLLASGEKSVDEIAEMSMELLHTVHDSEPSPGALPQRRDIALKRLGDLAGQLPEEQYAKLRRLIEAIPADPHMLHGDYHVKNIMYQNGEPLLIDMDTICVGSPIFEFACMYFSYLSFAEIEKDNAMQFFGLPYETLEELLRKSIACYFADADPARVTGLENKFRLLAAVRLVTHFNRRRKRDPERAERFIAHGKTRIAELLPLVDDLSF